MASFPKNVAASMLLVLILSCSVDAGSTSQSDEEQENATDNEVGAGFWFMLLLLLFLLFYITYIWPKMERNYEEERRKVSQSRAENKRPRVENKELKEKRKIWAERNKRLSKARKIKQRGIERRRRNKETWDSKRSKLRELAEQVFTSITEFKIDLDDGRLEIYAEEGKFHYETSLARPLKNLKKEMLTDKENSFKRKQDPIRNGATCDLHWSTGLFTFEDCRYEATHYCRRCHSFCCRAHTSKMRTYGGHYVCTICNTNMQHD